MSCLHPPPSGGDAELYAFEVEPKLSFLHRSSSRLTLYEAAEMDLDEAFDGLIPAFYDIVEVIPDIGFTGRVADRNRRRDPPETTVEAVQYALRSRGLTALKEPATQERIKRCDDAARAKLRATVKKLRKSGGRQ